MNRHLNAAILAFSLIVGGASAVQIQGGSEHEERWEHIEAALKSEDPEQVGRAREEHLELFHALLPQAESLEQADPEDPLRRLVHSVAYTLAKDRDANLDSATSIDAWLCAQRTARGAERAAECAVRVASVLQPLWRHAEARDVLADVMPRLSPTGGMYPYVLRKAVEVHLRLGELKHAHQLLDDADLGALDERTQIALGGLRAQLYLRVGRVDSARPLVEDLLLRAEDLVGRDSRFANSLHGARKWRIQVAESSDDHRAVVELVDRYLLEEAFYQAAPKEAQRLMFRRAVALSQLETRGAAARGASTAALIAVESLDVDDATRTLAILGRARLSLHYGRFEEARTLLAEARTAGRDLGGDALEYELRATFLAARLGRLSHAPREQLVAARQALRETYRELVRRWDEVEDTSGLNFLNVHDERNLLNELARIELELEGVEGGTLAALALLTDFQNRGTLARKLRSQRGVEADGDVGAGMPGWLKELPDGHGVLVYFPTSTAGSIVFALDVRGSAVGELTFGAHLESLRREYIETRLIARSSSAVSAAHAAAERALARELSSELFPNAIAERMVGWSHLTLVGLDAAGGLPLAWLPLGVEAHLGVERAVSYLPLLELPELAGARARLDQPRRLDYALVTDITPQARLSERWSTVDSVALGARKKEALGAGYAAWETWSGGQATVAGLFERASSGVQCLQFLGHGVQVAERARPTHLVLQGEPGLLGCDEIEARAAEFAGPDLVVLTACRSGVGPERRGDPAAGDLAGAWFVGGARAVVVAETEVTLEQAWEASRDLHEALRDGASPAEALREARKASVARHGAMAPFEDGGLKVIGLGHETLLLAGNKIASTRGSVTPLALAIAASLGSILAVFLWRSRRARAPVRG